jgi:hypothetical protein
MATAPYTAPTAYQDEQPGGGRSVSNLARIPVLAENAVATAPRWRQDALARWGGPRRQRGQTIAEAKQIQPKRSAVPARVVVDHRKVEPMSEDEHRRRGEAPDRLWQEIKRAVAESSSKP